VERQHIFAMIAAVATANGIFSPDLLGIIALAPLWYPEWLPGDAATLFMLGSLIWATTTLLLGGVPAALIERSFPSIAAGPAPLWIWLAGVTLLSLSGLKRMLGLVIG
jgi:hypothetical protein